MEKIYSQSGLSNFAYDSTHDVGETASSKLFKNIKAMTAQDAIYREDETRTREDGYSDSWVFETIHIRELVKNVQNANVLDPNNPKITSFTFDPTEPSNLTPNNVNLIFRSMNQVDVCKDSLPKFVKDIMNKTSFNTFSTYNVNGVNVEQGKYYISQKIYEEGNGISSIVDLLENFASYDMEGKVTYFVIDPSSTNPVKDILDAGISAGEVLRFGFVAPFYDDVIRDETGVKYSDLTVHPLVVYKMLDKGNISKYILGSDSDLKILTIDTLSKLVSFNLDVEVAAFDDLFSVSAAFEGSFDPTDIEGIKGAAMSLYKGMIATEYALGNESDGYMGEKRANRSYITSEIIGGLLQTFGTSEIAKANAGLEETDKFDSSWLAFRKNHGGLPCTNASELHDNSYDLISPYEALGIRGILSICKDSLIELVSMPERGTFAIPGFVDSFEYMDEKTSILENMRTIDPSLVSKEMNSQTATVIYVSRIEPLLSSSIIPITRPTVDDIKSYASNGQFAFVGQSLYSQLHP